MKSIITYDRLEKVKNPIQEGEKCQCLRNLENLTPQRN